MKKCMSLLLCACLLLGGCTSAATPEESTAASIEETVTKPATEIVPTTKEETNAPLPQVPEQTEESVTDAEQEPEQTEEAVPNTEAVPDVEQKPETTPHTTGNPIGSNTGNTVNNTGNTATNPGNTATSTGNSTDTNTTGGLPAGLPKPTINDVLMFRKNLICIITGRSKTPEIFYFGNGTLRWYISHPRGITVDENGKLTPKYEGNYTVYVTDGVYTAEADVFVLNGLYDFDTSLRFDDREITLEAGQSKLIEAYGILDPVFYRSSNTAVVKTSGRNITAVAPGTAIIHAQSSGYHAAMIVKVVPASQEQIQISLNKTQLDLHVGDTYQLAYTYNGKGQLTWTDNLSSVARVDENGLVTVIGAGSTSIYLTDGDISAKCQVNATIAPGVKVESLTFSSTDQPLYDGITKRVGDYMTFAMDAKPYTASQETYVTSSNSSVVRVKQETVRGHAGFRLEYRQAGTCVITISSGDNAVQKSYTINVKSKYDCDPGKDMLTPEEFAYYATQVAVENGMSNAILPTGYLMAWRSDSELTWAAARSTGEGMPHHWWSIGYRYYVVTYEGTDEDGRHIFYLRGA